MKRTKRNTYQLQLLATLLLLITAFVLSACSSDDTNPTPATTPDSEIRFKPSVWQVMEGTRATTFDGGTLTSGSFICTAYNESTATENTIVNIIDNTVTWNGAGWDFEGGKRYWPNEALTLDFFAYMPTTIPSYITNTSDETEILTYEARNPQFKCNSLPMTYNRESPEAGQGTGLQEFVYALVEGEYKGKSPSGIVLSFQHPFARIKLQLSSAQEDIHINSITFKSIKNNGFYSHISGWTPEGETINFVATLNDDYEADDAIGTYIMVPQDWAGEIEISADWKVWDVTKTNTVSATVPTTWAAGHSYTYTLTITETDLIVDTSKYTEQW